MTQTAYKEGSKFPELTNGTLRLYSMRHCPYAHRTRLVLEHKGILYETININLRDKPVWFLERSPLGNVPVIEVDNRIVYDSLICNRYLDDIYPKAKLLPHDSYKQAKQLMFQEQFNVLIQSNQAAFKGNDKKKAFGEVLEKLPLLEDYLESDYLAGAEPGMVDFNIWPFVERLAVTMKIFNMEFPKDRFPKIAAYIDQMETLSAVQKTKIDVDTYAKWMKSFMNGNPDFDAGL